MMKEILALALAVVMMLTLAACGGKDAPEPTVARIARLLKNSERRC